MVLPPGELNGAVLQPQFVYSESFTAVAGNAVVVTNIVL